MPDRSRRILLVVASGDLLSQPLVEAVEAEFPWITVKRRPNLQDACVSFEYPVSLILVEAVFLDKVDSVADDFLRFHPMALTALMQEGRSSISIRMIADSRIIRSVLPMDLRLDVWLSVLRILLRGGEYFPPAMFGETTASHTDKEGNPAKNRESTGKPLQNFDALDTLTEREFQILEMVSVGLQNKNIAAKLHLSENTIKIHLHNIIAKLDVTNRTEAAAMLHESRRTSAAQAPDLSRIRKPFE